MILEMKLLSDTCPGSGEGVIGIIDSDVTFDEFGLPYIPSKRIKGCLKEIAVDISDIEGDETKKIVNELFGLPGQAYGGVLIVDNGYIIEYKNFRDIIKNGQRSNCYKQLFDTALIKEYYTYLRTQTAIDSEKGIADESSLRITRALKKGLIFEFNISFEENDNKRLADYTAFLTRCCNALRHIGLNRTRGFGEVKCIVRENLKHGINRESFNNKLLSKVDGLFCFDYTITLNTPCCLDSNYISGGTILGVLAGVFIKENNLKTENAHNDKTFKRLFLSSDVKYLNAYPIDNYKRLLPIPFSIVKSKTGTSIYDTASEGGYDIVCDNFTEQFKNLDYEFGIIDDDLIKVISVKRELYYHHRRPEDRNIGHANIDGDFFKYEAICAEQSFKGLILGNYEDVKILYDLMSKKHEVRVGTSRNVQYGSCKIETGNISLFEREAEINEIGLDNLIITLTSPMILQNENGFNDSDIKLFLKELPKGLELDRCFIKKTEAGGYNSKWGMPKIQAQAIEAGSVFVFKNNENIDIKNIEIKSYGIRVNEGYGRVIVNSHGYNEELIIDKIINKDNEILSNISDIKNEVANKYIDYGAVNLLMQYIFKDIYEGNNMARNGEAIVNGFESNSSITNIIMMLRTSNSIGEFINQLDNRDGAKGKQYYGSLSKNLNKNNNSKDNFLDNIRDIIGSNNTISQFRGIYEKLFLDDEFVFSMFKSYYLTLLNKVKMEKRCK